MLFRVVQRHRRTHSRRSALNDDATQVDALPASSARAPDKSAETGETVRLLEEILDALDPDQRAVLVLADIEEKTVAEVASILDINNNTAASRLRAGARACRGQRWRDTVPATAGGSSEH